MDVSVRAVQVVPALYPCPRAALRELIRSRGELSVRHSQLERCHELFLEYDGQRVRAEITYRAVYSCGKLPQEILDAMHEALVEEMAVLIEENGESTAVSAVPPFFGDGS